MTIGAHPSDRHAYLGEAPLRQARNSAAFWAATGRARRHEVIHRRGFLAVAGDERAGLRVLIQAPDLDADEVTEITALAGAAAGPVDAEDPFSSTDLTHLGLRRWQMPVMVRPPGPVAAPPPAVIRVRDEEDLRAADSRAWTCSSRGSTARPPGRASPSSTTGTAATTGWAPRRRSGPVAWGGRSCSPPSPRWPTCRSR